MRRFFNWLLLAALIGGGFAAYSYLGARFTAGKLVGPDSPFADRAIKFHFDGVPELPGQPRAWAITYTGSTLPGVRSAQVYISPTGTLLATRPRDLDVRLEAWDKTRVP